MEVSQCQMELVLLLEVKMLLLPVLQQRLLGKLLPNGGVVMVETIKLLQALEFLFKLQQVLPTLISIQIQGRNSISSIVLKEMTQVTVVTNLLMAPQQL